MAAGGKQARPQHLGKVVVSAIHWWLELGAAILLAAFIVFAFRQGMKVEPRDLDEKPEQLGGPSAL